MVSVGFIHSGGRSWTVPSLRKPRKCSGAFYWLGGVILIPRPPIIVRLNFHALKMLISRPEPLRSPQYMLKRPAVRFGKIPKCFRDPTHPFSTPNGPYFHL